MKIFIVCEASRSNSNERRFGSLDSQETVQLYRKGARRRDSRAAVDTCWWTYQDE
jgi:hypothetical protein